MTEYHVPGLWASECHPVEDGMDVEMPEGYAILKVEQIDADPWTEVVALVDEQAEDEALWSVPAFGTQPISEAYLQQELRRLHAAVEKAAGRETEKGTD